MSAPFIVAPHRVSCKAVTIEDIDRVLYDAEFMKELIKYPCVGLAHPQINDKDPLQFFITDIQLVINPIVLSHTDALIESDESCVTFPDYSPAVVERWLRIKVQYQTCDNNTLTIHVEELFGTEAIIFQHETDHLNSIYCYDKSLKEYHIIQ